jgi:hypothetical protein
MEAEFLPSPAAAEARYRTHQNGPDKPGYVRFLNQAIAPTMPYLRAGMRGLDYGCGPAPTLSVLLERDGLRCEDYDPFFRPALPEGPFDFVFATEVLEHCPQPRRDLDRIRGLLSPGGLFTIMTEPWTAQESFAAWHYARDFTHVCFYHARTLDYLCDAFGFEPLNRENPRVTVLRKRAEARSDPP